MMGCMGFQGTNHRNRCCTEQWADSMIRSSVIKVDEKKLPPPPPSSSSASSTALTTAALSPSGKGKTRERSHHQQQHASSSSSSSHRHASSSSNLSGKVHMRVRDPTSGSSTIVPVSVKAPRPRRPTGPAPQVACSKAMGSDLIMYAWPPERPMEDDTRKLPIGIFETEREGVFETAEERDRRRSRLQAALSPGGGGGGGTIDGRRERVLGNRLMMMTDMFSGKLAVLDELQVNENGERGRVVARVLSYV